MIANLIQNCVELFISIKILISTIFISLSEISKISNDNLKFVSAK